MWSDPSQPTKPALAAPQTRETKPPLIEVRGSDLQTCLLALESLLKKRKTATRHLSRIRDLRARLGYRGTTLGPLTRALIQACQQREQMSILDEWICTPGCLTNESPPTCCHDPQEH
ncbi:MAG: uncharacterized protein KVP18_003156 [Porospora cf. gigantea A]|uniref:uncharacterized protein n=1 Tax=Porospora cf. gigantea A TaxID=2853593 RepID=UPI00355A8108|nr:MAG: hypothetical protein KVP18_003156 [Porospora cf. gigantea A]